MKHREPEGYEARLNLADLLGDYVLEPFDDIEEEEDTARDYHKSDNVSTVSEYNKLRKKHSKRKDLQEKYSSYSQEELIADYKKEETDPEVKDWLKEEVVLRVFFLQPYILRTNYKIPSAIFNDTLQNMTMAVIQAMNVFDPSLGLKFVNYLPGYFLGAVAKSFKDQNVVSVPTGKRRVLKELRESGQEILAYSGVHFDENYYMSNNSESFESRMHQEDLEMYLRAAMHPDSEVLTDDERLVLLHHYGLFDNDELTYKKISAKRPGKGCAYSRLSQIHKHAVTKLRKYFDSRKLEEY